MMLRGPADTEASLDCKSREPVRLVGAVVNAVNADPSLQVGSFANVLFLLIFGPRCVSLYGLDWSPSSSRLGMMGDSLGLTVVVFSAVDPLVTVIDITTVIRVRVHSPIVTTSGVFRDVDC